MKGAFGLVGLLLALAIVGMLVKKQLAATEQIAPALRMPAAQGVPGQDTAPTGTIKQQSQQMEQQYKNALESALHKGQSATEENAK